jgi:predicted Zn-dependent protease with MMP-like domain
MKRMSLKEFRDLVRQVLETMPDELKEHMRNIVVDVEKEPTYEDLLDAGLTEEEIEDGETVLGLFIPWPMDTEAMDLADQPHRILIFKRPHEEEFTDPDELRREVRKTVIHEVAHHFGYTDRDLEKWTSVY